MVEVVLPWDAPLLRGNDRLHHMERARRVRLVRGVVRDALTGSGVVSVPVVASLVWVVTDRRRRDPDNLAPMLKACIDGARDAGVLVDDSFEHVGEVRLRVERGSERALVFAVLSQEETDKGDVNDYEKGAGNSDGSAVGRCTGGSDRPGTGKCA